MTPASSSTVAVFHRRVGRYRLPMTRYLARRAVRRRSSSAVAWGHTTVSVGAPCRSFQFGENCNELNWNELDTTVQSSSRRRDPPSSLSSAGRQGLTLRHVVENRCWISGSNRCLHPGDTSRSSLEKELCCPVSPWQHCPVLSKLFWLARLTDTSYLRRSRSEASVRTDYPVELHRTATFFLLHYLYYSLHICIFTA